MRPADASAATASTASAATTSTASTAMPRVSFSLRSPPPPPSSSSPHEDADAVPVFTGDVWLPTTPSFFSFGLGAKWTKTTLTLWLARVVDDARPMLHLRLGDRAPVVATGLHRPPHAPKEDKPMVQVDVKAVDDVRRAVLYHTAAPTATLAFAVHSDAARGHVVALIHAALATTASPCPPSATVRPPSPPPVASPLERARAMHQRGHVVDALAAYAAAADASADDATRREIRAAVAALETQRAQPRVAVAAATVDVPALATRLAGLQSFADARDVDRAQRERRVAADDLALRLRALRNDAPTAPSLESLQQRLAKLPGGATGPSSSSSSLSTAKLSPVDQIIQQAMDEVALGIVDDHVDDDGLSTGSSDTSSDEDEEEEEPASRHGRRHGRRR